MTLKSDMQRERARAARILAELKRLFPNAKMILKYRSHWELLVAVELSAQCTDKKVNEVTAKLFKKYRSLADYVRVKQREFERDIYETGFYRNKAKNILAAAKMVKEKFGGKLPRTMAEMRSIPGVGRKTANIILGNAYGIVEGIAVDTHVHRLAHRLKLSKHENPEKIEQDLMRLFPKREWFRLTYRLIEYGRRYCTARPHKHEQCPLVKYET
jgi:endonuclease-3